ncbi:MAG: glycosyltransferase family 4 protein [Chloroflexi bacterium]|nr:glycosyltransferase family 4 protein [Chloroflexota bacterium]
MMLIPVRVGLLQRVLPEYRAPFFNALGSACPQGLGVFSGLPRPEEGIKVTLTLNQAHYVKGQNLHISHGKSYFCFQRGLIHWLRLWQPEVLIVEANARLLSTSLAIQWMHKRHLPVIGWGLGAPNSGKTESFLRNQFLNSFDAVIAYSHTGAEQYLKVGFDPEKVFVAANAVSPKPPLNAPQRRVLSGDNRPTLLFVGRLQERKRVDKLLQACAMLPADCQPELVIIGDGPDRFRLEQFAHQTYPQAIFTGAKHGAELDPFFQKADLFVLPGTGGLAVQQAMAHALAVIVGEADGTQGELVRPENGWILPDSKVTTLTRTLADAFQNRKRLREMGFASYRIVSEEVNLESMVETFAKAIKSVV